MARTEPAHAATTLVRKGEFAGGGDHARPADNGCHVVEGRVGKEDALEQLGGDARIDGHARLDDVLQAGLALEDDEGAVTLAGHARGGLGRPHRSCRPWGS